ncbi:MAG: hypothetical protein ACRC28_18495 [Clostridium sp.]|uniref:hypothetical protein n=1 Tax=Clostridium sp. TaxID=1506 RepID=UPI003F3E41EC
MTKKVVLTTEEEVVKEQYLRLSRWVAKKHGASVAKELNDKFGHLFITEKK